MSSDSTSVINQLFQLASQFSKKVFTTGLIPQKSAATSSEYVTLKSDRDPVAPFLNYHLSQSEEEESKVSTLFVQSSQFTPFLPSLFSLTESNKPAVLHVAIDRNDVNSNLETLTTLLSFKDLGISVIFSNNADEISDMALLAHTSALSTNSVVIHAFDLYLVYQKSNNASLEQDSVDQLIQKANDSESKNTIESILEEINQLRSSNYKSFELTNNVDSNQLSIGFNIFTSLPQADIRVRIYQPFNLSQLLSTLPSSFEKLDVWSWKTQLVAPLYLDLLNAQELATKVSLVVKEDIIPKASPVCATASNQIVPNDIPYISLLNQAFDNQLVIANQIGSPSVYGQSTHNRPEYGYGAILAQIKRRQQFVDLVTNVTLNSNLNIDTELRSGLSQWLLAKDNFEKSKAHSDSLIGLLAKSNIEGVSELEEINSQSYLFTKPSYWLVGSDEWSYDLSNSGLQNVISSEEDINILVLETENLDESKAKDVTKPRKKDLGLYAMNFGDVYVASSAINYSYSQAFKLVLEANEFKGPSVVLGYLPIVTGKDKDSLSDVFTLQQTKVAIDTGKWPIYRWLPSTEENGEDQFELFSSSIRKEIQDFLDRSSHLSALSRKVANIPKAQIGSQQINARAQIESKVQDAKDALNALLNGLNGPPLVVLYGSDGGRGEEVARRLDHGAKIRGFSSRCHPANEVPVEDIQHETIVLFVVSTAGQGEFPVNAKEFWKGLSASETTLPNLRFAVFGLGDSKYWPKEEDIIFYNKPGKDIHKKLASLNAQPIIDIGLGDDQDSDGFETQFQAWEPELWKALGAEVISGASDQFVLPTTLSDHDNKLQSNYMRGTIAEGLLDESTGGLSDRDTKLTKFHGIYQQDDRDIREERIERGLEFAYSFMARMRGCAGVFTTAQWLAMDKVAEEHCDGGLKITTRQTLQFHGILKKDLRKAIQGVNKALMTTLAACGDVNRNIMLTSVPVKKSIHDEIFQFSLKLDAHLLPRTNSYHEIWLDDKIVAGQAVQDVEPLYGPSYLPRKFKIAIAIPPSNDVDVRAHCLGYIAIIENDKVIGYNVTVGGGMGATHNNKKTYPRIADLLGFCTPEQAIDVGEKVMLIQRDFGERLNRKHARLKYTIEDMGVEKFKEELANRLGYPLQPAKPYEFKDNGDKFGWETDSDGLWHYNLYLENGRIRDTPGRPWKTGLREIANAHKDVFLLTPNQNLIIKNVKSEDKGKLQELMDKYNLSNVDFSQLRLNSMACVALPTCGLAMAEAERYLPKLIDRLDETILDCGLRDDSIIIRMSGCPNGCSRPYIAEIALVGKAPNTYNLFLGGGFYGDRVAKLYKESVDEEQILEVLRPLIKRYSLERHEGERFGDFVIRIGIVKPVLSTKDYHD